MQHLTDMLNLNINLIIYNMGSASSIQQDKSNQSKLYNNSIKIIEKNNIEENSIFSFFKKQYNISEFIFNHLQNN